jgi:hypothetical protein
LLLLSFRIRHRGKTRIGSLEVSHTPAKRFI